MVAVRVADACLTDLDHELIALRKQFRFHERHAFRHASCTAVLRENFLKSVCRIEFAAWARIIAKSTEWRDRFRPSEPGDQRLVQALIDVLVCIPPMSTSPRPYCSISRRPKIIGYGGRRKRFVSAIARVAILTSRR